MKVNVKIVLWIKLNYIVYDKEMFLKKIIMEVNTVYCIMYALYNIMKKSI